MLLDAAVQATSEQPQRNCSEYEPRELSADERDAIMASSGFTDFLARIRPRCATILGWTSCVHTVCHWHVQCIEMRLVVNTLPRLQSIYMRQRTGGRLCWRRTRR